MSVHEGAASDSRLSQGSLRNETVSEFVDFGVERAFRGSVVQILLRPGPHVYVRQGCIHFRAAVEFLRHVSLP